MMSRLYRCRQTLSQSFRCCCPPSTHLPHDVLWEPRCPVCCLPLKLPHSTLLLVWHYSRLCLLFAHYNDFPMLLTQVSPLSTFQANNRCHTLIVSPNYFQSIPSHPINLTTQPRPPHRPRYISTTHMGLDLSAFITPGSPFRFEAT